jgi:L-fuculose-phosphate aldolase
LNTESIEFRREFIEVCKLMADRRLVAGTEGNASGRAPDGSIIMSPAGHNLAELTVDMLVAVDLDGIVVEGSLAPTSEMPMHLGFYRQRPKTMGVMHGHPPFATAFAAAGRELPHNILPELVAVIGKIPTIPYGRPSSPKLAAALAPHATNYNVFLLQNHGAVAAGSSVRDAYHRLEVAEAYAKTAWAAESLGGMQSLTPAQIADLPEPSFD